MGDRIAIGRRIMTSAIARCSAFFLFAGLSLSPLAWARVPPLVDYPDHLARMSILAFSDPSRELVNYVPNWRLLPNLAMDLIVPPLAHLIPLEVAGRVFIAMTMAMIVLGTAALHRVINGRTGLWPLAALLFLYDEPLWGGMLNFMFSLGAALLTFSGWLAARDWQIRVRLLVFAPAAVLLLIFHLFGFVIYALLVGSYELGQLISSRPFSSRMVATSLAYLGQFIPGAALFLASSHNLGTYTAFGTLDRKLVIWFSPGTFNGYPTALDKMILMIGVVFLIMALVTRTLKIASSMRLPILAMIATAVLVPEWIRGTWGADLRLPATIPFVVIASSRLEISRPWQAVGVAFGSIAAMLLLILRIWAVSMGWHDMDARFEEFREAARGLPSSARLLTAESPMPDAFRKFDGVPLALAYRRPIEFWHMPTLAVIDSGVFVKDVFTKFAPIAPAPRNYDLDRERSHWQPLSYDELERRASPDFVKDPAFAPDEDGEQPCCVDWRRTYDFVVWLDYGNPPLQVPPGLEEYRKGSFFHIYRVIRN